MANDCASYLEINFVLSSGLDVNDNTSDNSINKYISSTDYTWTSSSKSYTCSSALNITNRNSSDAFNHMQNQLLDVYVSILLFENDDYEISFKNDITIFCASLLNKINRINTKLGFRNNYNYGYILYLKCQNFDLKCYQNCFRSNITTLL